MYQSIYDSGWHHPGICWGLGLLVLALLLRRLSTHPGKASWSLKALLVFQLVIMTDAWFTGALTPIDPKGALSGNLAIAFVIAGDLRFFLLFERQQQPLSTTWWLRALGWSLAIPIASLAARWLWPGNSRALFLCYETMFMLLALGFALLRVPRMKAGAERSWLSKLSWFEVGQYAAWVSADILILSGVEQGLLLRLVPNTLYYALFVPFALVSMPEEVSQA